MSDVLPHESQVIGGQTRPDPRARRLLRGIGLLLIIVSALSAYFLTVTYLAWQSGQTLQTERHDRQLAQQISRQTDLARSDIEEGHYTLAQRRLEWVLERAPDYADAQLLQQEAQSRLNNVLTPDSSQIIVTSTAPIPTSEPTPTPGLIENPHDELQRIRGLVTREKWQEALSALIAFQMQFPDYERQTTDQLIYDAYKNVGLELVKGEQVELGLYYLEQAEKLGDLSQEVLDYRTWAELYLQGIVFYGTTNWEATAYYFRNLCAAAPFYQSSCDRLHEVLILQGDQYVAAGEWCPAEELYREARQHGRTQSLIQKLQEAQENCVLATPTPSMPITNTLPLTNTQPTTLFAVPTKVGRPPNP